MGDVPAGGVPWEVFNAPQRERIEYWANQYGIPVQIVMNQLWRESGFGNIQQGTGYIHPNAPTHGRGVSGPAGLAVVTVFALEWLLAASPITWVSGEVCTACPVNSVRTVRIVGFRDNPRDWLAPDLARGPVRVVAPELVPEYARGVR